MHEVYGLVGEKLSHSLSPMIHKMLFNKKGTDSEYRLFEVPRDGLQAFIEKVKNSDIRGLNVTIPYKQSVIGYLDDISPAAKSIGAVNTISKKDGKLFGDNTDFAGLIMLLKSNAVDPAGKTVAILGTGGAAKAAAAAVQKMGAAKVYFVTRTKGKDAVTYDELRQLCGYLLINATPVGMHPDNCACPVDESIVSNFDTVVDLIYNPPQTMLLKTAEKLGKKSTSGLLMLAAQAAFAQSIWKGHAFCNDEIREVCDVVERLRKRKLISIIGMPGSGKTEIGRLLSKLTGLGFIDADEHIQAISGKTIPQLFEQGEGVFREIEKMSINELMKLENTVVALGGGVILSSDNVKILRENSLVLFLDRPVHSIALDIDLSTRPLLKDGVHKLFDLFEKRYPLYKNAAHVRIKNANTAEETAKCIAKLLNLGG